MVDAQIPAVIAGTTVHDIAPASGGEPYRIFLHVPSSPAPAAGWPVLYMTDGNAVIATAVDAMRVQASYPLGTNVGAGVIVAIGYPTGDPYDPLRRSWDLSPPPGQAYPAFHDGGLDVRTGGAAEFLTFIGDELKPWIESRLKIDRARQALFGHSFGGLLTLYAFLHRPAAFATWICASPAIYWEDRRHRSFAGCLRQCLGVELPCRDHPVGRRVRDGEAGPVPDRRRRRSRATGAQDRHADGLARTRDGCAARQLARPLAGGGFELHAGENHMSILPVAVNRAVQAAFAIVRKRVPA